MTFDDKLYILTDVTINESEVRGVVKSTPSERLRGNQSEEVIILIKEIKKIEDAEYDYALSAVGIIVGIGIGGVFLLVVGIGLNIKGK